MFAWYITGSWNEIDVVGMKNLLKLHLATTKKGYWTNFLMSQHYANYSFVLYIETRTYLLHNLIGQMNFRCNVAQVTNDTLAVPVRSKK